LRELLFQFSAGFAIVARARSRLRPGRTKPTNAGLALRPLARQDHLVGPSQGSRPPVLTEPHNELATPNHSITSSARASSDGGTSRPSALAVLRLIAYSNLVGACTGRSAALAPRRMRST